MLEEERRQFQPTIPDLLKQLKGSFKEGKATEALSNKEEIQKRFPSIYGKPILSRDQSLEGPQPKALRCGVVFSGGQAAGGHNVIAGLFDALIEIDSKSELIGFMEGPSGILEKKYRILDRDIIDRFRNMGGFDLLGSGRTKIETDEQLKLALEVVHNLKLDGLVIIGGDDSNTNAAVLTEYFICNGCHTCVVGVPKTIDGDLKNEYIESSFGFDTATKCYAEMIGNIERDAISARKYYHFIKLMGRSASHIALECALKTHPNYTLIGEEVKEKKLTLKDITEDICEMIVKRSEMDHHFGVILIPEGLIEFIPEMRALISELNDLIAQGKDDPLSALNQETKKTFETLPEGVQKQLLIDRDPHGNVQVSHIATEKLIVESVKKRLKSWKGYQGKFSAVEHFFGYEGRAAYPSNFDVNYCTALGRTAALLVHEKYSGYMSALRSLTLPANQWLPCGIPLPSMMHMEKRKGTLKPVIRKALVDLDGKAFKTFKEQREEWKYEPCYRYVGPIQYFGPASIVDEIPQTLQLES